MRSVRLLALHSTPKLLRICSRDGQKERGQRMGRSENAASRWAHRAACCRGHIVGQRGGDPREDPGHAGEAGMLDGQGHFGVQYRRSIPSSSLARKHAVHGATSTPCHSALGHCSEPSEKAVSYRLPFDRTWVIAN